MNETRDTKKPAVVADDEDDGVPYDRGWAWVIDLGFFLVFFIYLSHDNWHSILLTDYMNEFNISVSLVTVMLALGSLCYCVGTQVSTNLLVIKFSIRKVTTCAAIINFSATLLFAAAPNVATFFIANLIKYIARGVTLIPTMILVGLYFKRRRGLAVTLGCLGISSTFMGSPPLIRYLRDEYGFRGCFLIMAGLEMHGVAAALLLRPINSYKRKKGRPEPLGVEMEEINPLLAKKFEDQSETMHPIENEEPLPLPLASIAEIAIEEEDEMSVDPSFSKKTLLEQNEDVNFSGKAKSYNGVETKIQSGMNPDMAINSIKSQVLQNGHSDESNSSGQFCNETNVQDIVVRQDTIEDTTNVINYDKYDPALTEDISYKSDSQITSKNTAENANPGSKMKNTIFSQEKTLGNSSIIITKVQSSTHKNHDVDSAELRTSHASIWSLVTTSTMGSTLNIPHVTELQESEDETPVSRLHRWQWVRGLFDVSLLKNYIALMVVVMYILISAAGFSNVYLPSYAERVGVSPQNAAVLLTIVGAMDIVGRLFFGFFADLKLVRPHLIVVVSSACVGTVMHFMVLLDGFEKLMFFSVVKGFLAGAGHNLLTLIIIDVLGVQCLSKLLSTSSVCNSLFLLIQHPIIGVITEATGNFVVTFHYIGTSLILASIVLLCEPLIRKLQMAKEERQKLKQDSRDEI